jgi:MFS family permease
VLIAGWVVAAPVPFLLMWAPTWRWVLVANALLGISQGLTWSTTVIMKIDLVGASRRGLAMGLNEFSGYVAVAGSALATGYLAAEYGLRPVPFYPGAAFVVMGLGLWRDLGYAIGALLAGVAADFFGLAVAMWIVAVLTLLSGVIVAIRVAETLPKLRRPLRGELSVQG